MCASSIYTIILNTNRKQDTLEALGSLFANQYSNFKVILLDNHSTDGSVVAIRTEFPQVQVIELEKNLGYTGNNNIGIEAAIQQGADWLLVLNEDTLLAPDCLEHLVEAGEADAGIGIVGPMVYHHDEPDIIQSAGGSLGAWWRSKHIGQNERDRGQFTTPLPVEWVSGCAIMLRRQVIEQIGGLDERFFYYWEETEWCVRARKAGWQIVHVPAAKLWHKGVQRLYQPNVSVAYYNTRNRFLMFSKHKAPLKAWGFAWFETVRTLLSLSLRTKWRDKREHRDAMFQGMLDFLRHRWGKRLEKTG